MNAAKEARDFTRLRELQRLLRLYEAEHGPVCGVTILRNHVVEQMRRAAKLVRYGAPLLAMALFVVPALAHDSWISKGGHRNAAGEWCCGEGDCETINPDTITVTDRSYKLSPSETVPYREAQPSPDGQFWRCHRPDGTRRCFFAPPPGS